MDLYRGNSGNGVITVSFVPQGKIYRYSGSALRERHLQLSELRLLDILYTAYYSQPTGHSSLGCSFDTGAFCQVLNGNTGTFE